MSETPTAGLMTSQQACDYLGISDNTLRRWCELGLPYIQPPGMLKRFRKADIDAYLETLAQQAADASYARLLSERSGD